MEIVVLQKHEFCMFHSCCLEIINSQFQTNWSQLQSNLLEHGEICFDEPEVHIRQSQKTIQLKLIRKTGTTGRVVVPWSIQDAPYGSPYQVYLIEWCFELDWVTDNDLKLQGLKGQEKFNDGEKESHIEIDLPSSPQEKGEETIK